MVGYLFRHLPLWLRPAFIIAGICLMIPDQIAWWAAGTDLAGAIGGAGLLGYELLVRRRLNASAAAITRN
jgi:hypothetical protein